MKNATAKGEIQSTLARRFGDIFEHRAKHAVDTLATGIAEIDDSFGGLPRGAISEIHGSASSGRTSLLLATLGFATSQEEMCVLVDCDDAFDVSSGVKARVDFDRLLWVRCRTNLERAFKAVDLLLHGGGFGLVALNLCGVPEKTLGRIISTWWFRFRRAIENTPTALIVLTPAAVVRSGAALALEVKNEATVWPSTSSLVSENRNSGCTDETDEKERNHLSLVESVAQSTSGSTLNHSQFFRAMRIRVNRERPVEWCPGAVRFQTQLH